MHSNTMGNRMSNLLKPWLWVACVIASSAAFAEERASADFVVYKNAQCMCCDAWVEHMRAAGYTLDLKVPDSMDAIKSEHGLGPRLQSCHTAVHTESGLVFEGHIPAEHVTRLIDDPAPGAKGLTVPGMPIGSPGMEMGNRKDPYNVLLLSESGKVSLFAREHQGN